MLGTDAWIRAVVSNGITTVGGVGLTQNSP